MSNRPRLILIAIFVFFAWLAMGDFEARIAATHGDDGPVFYSLFAANPGHWDGDIMALFAGTQVKVTAQNWLPSLAYSHLGFPPEQSARVLVFLQFVLLALAVFDLAKQASGNRWVALNAPFWVLATMPWQWNLANYESNLMTPYAADLGRPLLLLAVSRILAKDYRLAFLSLLCLAFVHPSFTLYGALILFCYALKSNLSLPKTLLSSAAVAATAVLPALFLLGGHDQVSNEVLLEGLRLNQHISPWNYMFGWRPASWSFAGFTLLLVTALLRKASTLENQYKRLCWIVLALTPLMAAVHLFSFWMGWVMFLKLLPLRFTALTVIIGVPAVLELLISLVDEDEIWRRWVGFSLLLFPVFLHFGCLWGLLLAVLLKDGRTVALGWGCATVLVFLFPEYLEFLLPGSRGLIPYQLLALLLSAVGFAKIPKEQRQKTLLGLIFLGSLYQAYFLSRPTYSPYQQSLLLAQQWALENTEKSSVFVVENAPWRTVSQRRAVVPRASVWYVYNGSKEVRAKDDAYLDFFGLRPAFLQADILQMHFAQIQAFYSLRGERLGQFVQLFGGDYLVHSRRWVGELPEMALPIAYQNDVFVIYSLGEVAKQSVESSSH